MKRLFSTLVIWMLLLTSCKQYTPTPSEAVFFLPGGVEKRQEEALNQQIRTRLNALLYTSVKYTITVNKDETVTIHFEDYTLSSAESALLCNRRDTPVVVDVEGKTVLSPHQWTKATFVLDTTSTNPADAMYAIVLELTEEGKKQILIESGRILATKNPVVRVKFGQEVLAEMAVHSRITGEAGLSLTGFSLDEARLGVAKLCLPPLDFDLSPNKII
ncbi:MAG TPA: hypothetical protein DCY74_09000 [Clostridiales bacterium]|jgi:hypothetical protein|nr:hypothetical protein [Clostridiales bacterium]